MRCIASRAVLSSLPRTRAHARYIAARKHTVELALGLQTSQFQTAIPTVLTRGSIVMAQSMAYYDKIEYTTGHASLGPRKA